MITDTGKKILAKYLIGQTPSYASHIAVGCGARPLSSAAPGLEDYSDRKSLDLEMFRAPIISRGFVTEGGVTSVVLTAEVPTAERYEITELGLYPSATNPSAGDAGSRSLFLFSSSENWEYHEGSGNRSATRLQSVEEPNLATTPQDAFVTRASANMFNDERLERPRFLSDAIVLSGDSANLLSVDGVIREDPELVSDHIHFNGISLSTLDSNTSDDEIRLAFSIANADPSTTNDNYPTNAKILIVFQSTEGSTANAQSATWSIDLSNGNTLDNGDIVDFANNRYYVVSIKIGDLARTIGFTWASVTSIKIATDITGPETFYLALDAMQLVNLTTENPLYGLVGYSKLKTIDSQPVLKETNTRSFIEFRFGIDMGTEIVS